MNWCPQPDSNRHAISARDFKSLVSTNSTTGAIIPVPSIDCLLMMF
jgi:hypothetical protein